MLPNLFLMSVLIWVATESARYWTRLVRRSAIGLADPLMVNRMLLYAIGSALSSATILVVTVPALWGIDALTDPRLMALSGLIGAPIGPIYYLALVPPKAYERWLLSESAPAAPRES